MADITGETFGKLKVISRARKDRYSNQWWSCVCQCGTTIEVLSSQLKNGIVDGCKDCRTGVIGRRFGRLVVLEKVGVGTDFGLKTRGRVVRCKCSCGGSWQGPIESLWRGNTRSCGCLPKGRSPDRNREGPAARAVLKNYRRHAARRGLSWGLTDQEFFTLIKEPCYYCGSPPSNVSCPNRTREGQRRLVTSTVVYSGVDRKDNCKGYTSENTVSCCAVCNYGKRGLSAEQFLKHVQLIHRRHFS